jgi:hypothetical protein
MSEPFDPYRDALVVETETVWPPESPLMGENERRRIEVQLHADAQHVAQLDYVRLPTGFCRRITVTAADLERLKNG